MIDPKQFRSALGCYPTGVTVVTTIDENAQTRGFTANSFTSVSLDPPLLLICIAKTASSHDVFTNTQGFVVNILSESQKDISSLFASKVPNKFEGCEWTNSQNGYPVIADVVAYFDCKTYNKIDAGDHTILIGQVTDFAARAAKPLGYCQGSYVNYSDAKTLELASLAQTRLFALIETPEGLIFEQSSQGVLVLPNADRLGKEHAESGLYAKLKKHGLQASLDFVYSVYEDEQGPVIVYRGKSSSTVNSQMTAHSQLACLSLEQVAAYSWTDEALGSMLRRYVKERKEDVFGIYVGDSQTGDVMPLAVSRK
jgi:flavin reductase (DIM6/NTAB) family NADH-FMN oxidoreductase RutF